MTGPGDHAPQPESREYVQKILEHDAEDLRERRELRRAAPRKRRYRVMVMLFVVLAVLVGANLIRALNAPVPFTRAEEEAAARFTIFLVVQGIAAFRDSLGVLPRDLATAELDESGLSYVASGDSAYTLSYQDGDLSLTYRSGESLAPFAAAYDALREVTR